MAVLCKLQTTVNFSELLFSMCPLSSITHSNSKSLIPPGETENEVTGLSEVDVVPDLVVQEWKILDAERHNESLEKLCNCSWNCYKTRKARLLGFS